MNHGIPPEENLPPHQQVWIEGIEVEVPDGVTSAEQRQALFDTARTIVQDMPVVDYVESGSDQTSQIQKATFTGEAIGEPKIIGGYVSYERVLDGSRETTVLYLSEPIDPYRQVGWLKNHTVQEYIFAIDKTLVNGEIDYNLSYDDFASLNHGDNAMNEELFYEFAAFLAALEARPEALHPETS